MTQDNKELLFKDLSARLPYETMFYSDKYGDECLLSIDLEYNKINEVYNIEDIKIYLRSLSNMTEKECLELSRLQPSVGDCWKYIKTPVPLRLANNGQFDFFNSHHLDWRCLIEKGLALEAPEEMYDIKD